MNTNFIILAFLENPIFSMNKKFIYTHEFWT
jgi:hypothetical protein